LEKLSISHSFNLHVYKQEKVYRDTCTISYSRFK